MQSLEKPSLRMAAFEPKPSAENRRNPHSQGNTDPTTTSLHPNIFKAFAGINAGILGVFVIIFAADPRTLFMVAISGIYLLAYLGTPFVLNRLGRFDEPNTNSFYRFLSQPVQTWTGKITGKEAMIQVLLVPLAILHAVIGMAIIIGLSR